MVSSYKMASTQKRSSLKIPLYTSQDLKIMAIFLPIIILGINYVIFDSRYFTSPEILLGATLITGIVMTANWMMSGWVAVTVRNRFPRDDEWPKMIGVMLLLIILLMIVSLTLLFYGYDKLSLFGYTLSESRYWWSLLGGVVLNVLITLIHVGMDSFQKWKSTLTETEQLKKEFLQSKVLGLKSQVNPHFLFNSLNSLSCLICENPKRAERFLDEMSKVYRYLLRSDDSALVLLETELSFINSFYFLIKQRYGEGIELTVDVDRPEFLIPPLTLYILVENILNQNSILKDDPLHITIGTKGDRLEIRNNIKPRPMREGEWNETSLNNIMNKYKLLCGEEVIVITTAAHQVIQLPLIAEKMEQA